MTHGIQEARYLAVALKAIRLSQFLEKDIAELSPESLGALVELDGAIQGVFGLSPDADFCSAKAEVVKRILAYRPRDLDTGKIVFDDVEPAPIDLLLYCPQCGIQHIDLPQPEKGWTNPPHRSHECQSCGWVWRPADVTTNGVEKIQTAGKFDKSPVPSLLDRGPA